MDKTYMQQNGLNCFFKGFLGVITAGGYHFFVNSENNRVTTETRTRTI